MSAPHGDDNTAGPNGPDDESAEDLAAQQALARAAQAAGDDDADGDEDDGDDSSFDLDRARKAIQKKNREAQGLREQLKKLRPLAEEAEKRRQGEMTAAQKLTEEKAALEVELSELRVANVRREAAEEAGLPARFVKYINAAEPKEALAQAKELAKELRPADSDQQRTTKADLRQGARGANGAGSSMSPDDLLRRMAGR